MLTKTKTAKSAKQVPVGAVTVELPEDFDVIGAIALPTLLKRIPLRVAVTLDFRHVRMLSERTLAALVPALGSLKDRLLFSEGLPEQAQRVLRRMGVGPATVLAVHPV